MSSLLGLGERTAGLWAGASIHEVAQVVATGRILGGVALQAAVVVKLTRVLLLAPVVALLGLRARRAARAHGGGMPGVRRPPLVPLFVVGFLAAVALRGVGIVPEGALEVLATAQTLLFAAAMFALELWGAPGDVRARRRTPVALAALTTTVVACIGLGGGCSCSRRKGRIVSAHCLPRSRRLASRDGCLYSNAGSRTIRARGRSGRLPPADGRGAGGRAAQPPRPRRRPRRGLTQLLDNMPAGVTRSVEAACDEGMGLP